MNQDFTDEAGRGGGRPLMLGKTGLRGYATAVRPEGTLFRS